MAKLIEKGTNYAYTIERIKDITFTKLRSVVVDFTRRLPADLNSELYEAIQHGVCQLQSEPELNMYIHALGLMHEAKLQHAFEHLPSEFTDHNAIEIIDYGCGQAIGTICYADFLRKNGYAQEVRKITLIEPSEIALKRAALHASCFFPNAEIITINKGFDDLVDDDFSIDYDIPTLHIFSNVLDLADDYFNLKSFAYLLRDCIIGINQFVCVEPYFDYDEIDEYPYLFFKFLNIDDEELTYCKIYHKGSFVEGRDWTCHIVLGSTYIHIGGCTTSYIKGFDEDGAREEYEAERAAEEQRFEDAYKLYEISAQKGNADAYYQLGEYNYFGKGIEKNEVEAIKWYRKAAEKGSNYEQALLRLGDCYSYGIGVVENKFEAVKYYKEATEYGFSKAEVALGKCYLNGEGIEQDYEDAVRYFRRANYRNAEAQFYLGLCYEEGKGVKSIPTEAVKWYRKAAEQGHNEAQFRLGRCYHNGFGVTQDYQSAVKWYCKAAEQGNAFAQHNLGYCYVNGEGVEQNLAEAVKWYKKAAEQGTALSQNALGDCYELGEGVEQNYTTAAIWYHKAAEQGDAEAQFNLGVCYANGKGVEQDDIEAQNWFRLAANGGHTKAKEMLDEV
ncbi:MAG: SEL1-like repeat protein [Alistipes sp.]|nr:SEL1-like repeat protein [Alistipes sp.]